MIARHVILGLTLKCAALIIGTFLFFFSLRIALGHTYVICCCSDPTDPTSDATRKKKKEACPDFLAS